MKTFLVVFGLESFYYFSESFSRAYKRKLASMLKFTLMKELLGILLYKSLAVG